MSTWFWEKIKFISGALIVLVFFGVLVYASNIEVKDMDIWLHLASGRYMLTHLTISQADFLSCTVSGHPWINHEWLFQVIVASIYNNSGIPGLILMQVIVIGFIFALLFLLGFNGKDFVFQMFILFIVMMVFHSRMIHRPDIFSALFIVLFFYSLSYKLQDRSVIFIMFLLQVLWTNIHGFFIVGPVIVTLGLLSETIKRKFRLPFEWNNVGRLDNEEFMNLKFVLLAVIAACFVNPSFVKGALYPFKILFSMSGDSKIFLKYIVELQKPISFNTIFLLDSYLPLKAMIVISFLSFCSNYKKIDLGLLILWMVFLVLSLSAVRNSAFFSIIAYFVIIANFSQSNILSKVFKPDGKTNIKNIIAILLSGILIAWMLNYCGELSLKGYYDFDNYERKQEIGGVSQHYYPNKAGDFLVKNNVKGNFFNDFNSGSYILGRTYPNIKVAIDGRTELYGPAMFKKIMVAWHGNIDSLQKILNKYDITGALIASIYSPIPKDTVKYFYTNKDWKLVYFNYDGVIFLKDAPINREVIKNHEVDLSEYETKPMDIVKIGPTNITPYRYYNRAESLNRLGFPEKAKQEALEAIRVAPYYANPYKLMARIYRDEKNYEKEYEYMRLARVLDPRDNNVRLEVALALYDIKEYDLAKKRAIKVFNTGDRRVELLDLLSLLFAREGDAGNSLIFLKEAVKKSSGNIDTIVEVGDIFSDNGDCADAVKAYSLGENPEGDNNILSEKISACSDK